MTIHEKHTFDDVRTLSIMDNRFHHFLGEDEKMYTSFSGIIVPYNIGTTLALWRLTDSSIYQNLIDWKALEEEIKRLNPNNTDIDEPDFHLIYFLSSKLLDLMKDYTSDQLNDLAEII